MIKALKVVMIVYGVVLILVGLGVIIVPDKMAELWRLGEIAVPIFILFSILHFIRENRAGQLIHQQN